MTPTKPCNGTKSVLRWQPDPANSLNGRDYFGFMAEGHRDFLILTPNTILFDKTIENFTPRAVKSIFW